MVSKCGSEMSAHIPAIVSLCLEYITYDPNYNYDEEDDSDMECDDDDEDGSDDEYSDDDDVSWKERFRSIKEKIDYFLRGHVPFAKYLLIFNSGEKGSCQVS